MTTDLLQLLGQRPIRSCDSLSNFQYSSLGYPLSTIAQALRVVDDQTGSIATGYCVSAPSSRSMSGVRVSLPSPTATSTVDTCADSDGPLSTGGRLGSSAATARRLSTAGSAGAVESHMVGAPPSKTGWPVASSVATRPPSSSRATVTPAVFRPNSSSCSRSFLAASAFFTTSTCEKPVGVTVTTRSTPFSTSV